MPSIEKLKNHFEGRPFDVYIINMQETNKKVRSFIEKERYTLSVLMDYDGDVSARYRVRSHPTSFLIDAGGNMIGHSAGYRQWDSPEMKTLVEKLLKEAEKEKI